MTNRNQSGTQSLVTSEMLQNLPEPVQRYLNYTAVVGKPRIETVYLKQTGKFRQGLDRPWMPMSAEQWYTTNPPGFLWKAQFKIAGLPLLHARDEYQSGQGHMFGKLAGLFTIFDVRGEQLDQGAMLRYLSEMIWFPTAFLGENITWKSRDDHTAQVTFTDHGKSVSGLIHFDETGKFTNFTADRYREIDGDFSLDPWSTPVERYGVLAGLNLPVHGKAVWNLPEGDFAYVDLEITEIKYNTPA
ncbi:MAG: DUF6544 family protein [Anaerolineales bacterium]